MTTSFELRCEESANTSPRVDGRQVFHRLRLRPFGRGVEFRAMSADLGRPSRGCKFENPFLLSSAPPTESDSNIMRAFDAGWGGVVTKTIGLHPVVNVEGPKTKFLRSDVDSPTLSMKKRPGTALHSSWNWELISDKPLDWWVPHLERIKKACPATHARRLDHGRLGQRHGAAPLADAGQGLPGRGRRRLRAEPLLPAHGPQGHGLEHRQGPGADLGRHAGRQGGREGPDLGEAHAVDDRHRRSKRARRFAGGADAISSSNTFPSLPLIDPETLEFEMNVDGLVSTRRPRRSGDPPALAGEDGADDAGVSRARASPASAASRTSRTRCPTSCSAAAPSRSAPRPCSTAPIGPNVIRGLEAGHDRVPGEERAPRLDETRRFSRRFAATASSRSLRSRRPDASDYHGGHEAAEGYAEPAEAHPDPRRRKIGWTTRLSFGSRSKRRGSASPRAASR